MPRQRRQSASWRLRSNRAAFALPGALTAIALSVARRVRGLVYWLFAGAAIAGLGYAWFPEASRTPWAFATLMAMGLGAGLTYWWAAGHRAGYFAAALTRARADINPS